MLERINKAEDRFAVFWLYLFQKNESCGLPAAMSLHRFGCGGRQVRHSPDTAARNRIRPVGRVSRVRTGGAGCRTRAVRRTAERGGWGGVMNGEVRRRQRMPNGLHGGMSDEAPQGIGLNNITCRTRRRVHGYIFDRNALILSRRRHGPRR